MDTSVAQKAALHTIGGRLIDYGRLIRLHQPTGIWLLGWPALWGLWLAASGHPHERTFTVFILGIVVTRSAGCAINDFADRKVDPYVKRTHDRPLAARRIMPSEAIVIYLILSFMAFGLVCLLDRLTIAYAVVGAVLTAVYPFLKRVMSVPQAWLGLAFSWSVPMAFIAESHAIPPAGWVLFMAGVLWTLVYDTEYAMVDRDDDRKVGIKSTALLFGEADRLIIGFCQIGVIALLALVGSLLHLGRWYVLGLVAGSCLFYFQQILLRHRERDACFRAFRNNAWFGAVIFIGIVLDGLFG